MSFYSLANNSAPSSSGLFEGPYRVEATFNNLPVVSVSYSNRLNSQVQWSVTVDGIQDIGSNVDVKLGYLSLRVVNSEGQVSGDGWQSPPLAILDAETSSNPPQTTYSGSDFYTYRLSSPGITMMTFFNRSVSDVLTSIGSQIGVQITVSGDSGKMEQFEVQSGSSSLEHISRICRDFGLNYCVTHDGISIFRDANPVSALPSDLLVTNVSHHRNVKDLVTKLVMRKKSKYTTNVGFKWDKSGIFSGTFNPPLDLRTIRYTEVAVAGHVGYIAYFSGTALSGYAVLDADNTPPMPPITGGPSIDNVTFDVVPNTPPFDTIQPKGELFIYGRPYALNPEYDVTFEIVVGAADEQNLNRIRVVESSLWQSLEVAKTFAGQLITGANRSADGYTVTAALDPNVIPGGDISVYSDFLSFSGRLEGVSFNLGGGAPTMNLEISTITNQSNSTITLPDSVITTTSESTRNPSTGVVTTTITSTTTNPQTGEVSTVTTTRTTNSIVITTPSSTP